MKTWKCVFAGVAAIIVLVFTGCENETTENDVAVNGVTLVKNELTLTVGDTETLTATVLPENASDKKVSWLSGDTGVVTVKNGIVTAVEEGTTTIIVTTRDGGKTAFCAVTVSYIAVDGITLDKGTLTLDIGVSEQLFPTVLPVDAYNRAISWTSSNTNVATVNAGSVTGVAQGTATITVATRNGKTAICEVTVNPAAVTGVTLIKTALTLLVGDTGFLAHTMQPLYASNKNVSWSSGNTGVATVDNGTVTAVTVGTANITVTTEDGGKTANCAVTVVAEMPRIEGMVWVRKGSFTMGSPISEPERWFDEIQHQVTLLDGFYMGKYPVTQEMYQELTGENFSRFKDPDGDDPEKRPVENISWYEAIVFCNKLSMQEGLSPAYTMYRIDAPNADRPVNRWTDIPANWSTDPADWGRVPTDDTHRRWDAVRMVEDSKGYRLPTEAQWEYACRAGTETPFNTGDNITTDQANYDGNFPYNNNPEGECLERTCEVGSYAANALGLFDMHGNVWEWCWDWYSAYRSDAQTDPTGPASGNFRVLRGGSWSANATFLRSAYRHGEYANEWTSDIGFRLVRPAVE